MAMIARMRSATISVLNLSQKTRVSTAASRDGGGAVGMRIVDLRASFGLRERALMPRETFPRKSGNLGATPRRPSMRSPFRLSAAISS